MLDQSAKLGKVHLTNRLDFSLSSLESAACRYFLDNVDPVTGLIFDSNSPQSDVSISATGFGLAAYVVMVARGELDRKEAAERILRALRFLWNAEQSEKKDATGGEEQGFFKITIREGSDKIIGATVVSQHAGDLISQLSMAMTCGVGLSDLASVIFPYPTHAEAIKRIANQYRRDRLKPWKRKILEFWFKVRRKF